MLLRNSHLLDAGVPFPLWAPTPSGAPCSHGVWVETPLDSRDNYPEREITLLIRAVDLIGQARVEAHGHPVAVTLLLPSGQYIPRDESAAQFLAFFPWFAAALAPELDWLRKRAARAAAQRDRRSCQAALARRTDALMVPYNELFPSDWDLIVGYQGIYYWVLDQHCPNPSCPCTMIVAHAYSIDPPNTQLLGNLKFDLRKPHSPSVVSVPLVARVYEALQRRYDDVLVRRHHEVRAVVRRSSSPAAVVAPTVAPPRGGPCPCGSGKKYKRCCAEARR